MANTGLLELNGKDLTVVIDEETAEKAPLASPAFTGTATLNGNNIATTNQIPDTSTLAAKTELANYLPLTGGTVSGGLTVNGTITGTLNGNASTATTATNANHATTADTATDNTKIRLTGARGQLAGYETTSTVTSLTVNATTPDSTYYNSTAAITVSNGSANQSWTKVVMFGQQPSSVNLGSSWSWVGGSVPTLAANGVLVLTWQNARGIANFLSPSA